MQRTVTVSPVSFDFFNINACDSCTVGCSHRSEFKYEVKNAENPPLNFPNDFINVLARYSGNQPTLQCLNRFMESTVVKLCQNCTSIATYILNTDRCTDQKAVSETYATLYFGKLVHTYHLKPLKLIKSARNVPKSYLDE